LLAALVVVGMAHCPHCGDEMDVPDAELILLDEFFDDAGDRVAVSGQEHVQLECPHCGAVLGYLGTAAATGV
jgi:predicted RNA-binding Zn-ribbon protein involved in translation (DUF1610 family)